MHRSKKKRNIVIFSLVGILLCMVVGYAAFQTRLEIKGTSKVTSNWNILITNVTDGTPTGSAENAVKPSWKNTSASMEANLYDKGDAMEYDVTIENKGTIDAKLNDILTNLQNSNSDAVIITFSGYTKGEVLQAGGSKLIHVKIEYNPEYEGGETSSEVEIDFEYTQDNKSEDIPDTYLLTYDYRTNGGERVDSEGEYLTSGSNVDLSNVAYKQGWRFVGWNTDKDAEVGMTSYQMKEQATTLYAIYSKDLTVTYEKGENVESISKNEDACTIYNNETSCEVTLPTITPSTGYAVDGWYNGNDKAGDPEDKYSLTNNITLTSKVSQNTYTVTYDYETNGGTSTTKENDEVNYGEEIDLTPTATKSGWTFVGWNTNKDATTGLSSLTMGDSNVTLYAIYRKEARTITITFNKNGSTSQTPSGGSANTANTLTQSCTIAAVYNNATQANSCNITSPTINPSSNTPTVVGYNTSSSATSSSWNHKTSKAVSSNATYYAITKKDAKTITVTFNKNGASSIGATSRSCTIAATYNGTAQGTTCSITSPTITASSGFSVLGWNTSSGSTSSAWTQNTAKSFSSNATYYAVTRSSSQLTATFNKNGATSIGSASQSCYRYNGGSSCNITTPSITRSGFTIAGWGTSASATSAAVKVNTSVAISSNITYYAVTSKVVTVTYSKGSNVSSIGSTSGTCTIRNSATNCQVTLPSITASSTYVADGWYSGSTRVGSAGAKYTVSSNTTLTGKSKADSISLSISTTSKTNSITVVATASATSGISKYEFSKDGGKTWVNGGTNKTYTFTGLTAGTSYSIQVRVTASSGKTSTTSKTVTTSTLTSPTFKETETSNGKTVTITYPSGCGSSLTCTYKKDNGTAVNVTSTTVNVSFTASGSLVATVSDGTNTVSSSYTVTVLPYTPGEATDVITELVSTNTDELYTDDNDNIRYYGAEPNNYVYYNCTNVNNQTSSTCELWRIMGIIDGKVKIIKDKVLKSVTTDNGVTIGNSRGFYWNKVRQSGKNWNNWEDSTLQTYLNGTYYNSLNSAYRNMISEETYYLGGATISNYRTLTASGFYNAERDNTQVYSGGSNDPNPASTTQHIGLMYPSDYGYAAGESCLSTALNNYDSSCKNTDYLFNSKNEWLQAPYAGNSILAADLSSPGYVDGYGNYVYNNSAAVRPVLYLNTSVQITDGIGSQSNPFKLLSDGQF